MRNQKRSATLNVVLAILVGTVLTQTHALAGEKILHNFNNNGTDGYSPQAGLVFDGSGNLYGTTYSGGSLNSGTVFELSPAKSGGWAERVLVNFYRIKPGVFPHASLILDAAGNLYGTTYEAGIYGGGTAFELIRQPNGRWIEKVLCDLGGHVDATINGALPLASLVFDATGNLYGTTHAGGSHGDGMVFELTPDTNGSWTESVPHFFTGPTEDGYGPASNLILDSAGNLYGTALNGGAYRAGIVFELSPVGDGTWTETLLHSFQKGVGDGFQPYGGLIFDNVGNLYGTTVAGGDTAGTVYELSPNGDGTWSEKVLHAFGKGLDGKNPDASLVVDAAGNLYGTTELGGALGAGTVFKLTPAEDGSWTEKVLHSFGNGIDGKNPVGSLIFDGAGNLYGATPGGGKYGSGMVFEITP